MYRLNPGRALLALALLGLAACSGITRNPLPAENYEQARVFDRTDLRFWGDRIDEHYMSEFLARADVESDYEGIMNREHHYLVISGGGANGAYGAGVLYAWSELETRPEFTVVTGISSGALTAPFAFLGPEYDDELREVYTTLDTSSIADLRNVFSVFGSDAVLDTTPLKRVIEQYVDEQMIADLAREFHRGRRLQIGTTNLDAGRPVVWDITRIAASGHEHSAGLIHDILRASAALPGAFPPVYIDVEGADGKRYDEMHVDGGVTSQMFFYPSNVDWDLVERRLGVVGGPPHPKITQ